MSVGVMHAVLTFRRPETTVEDVREECDVFRSVTDIVSALTDLNRSDLLGEYVAIFVNFSAEDEIEAAYGCRGRWYSDETVLEVIAIGPEPEEVC